MMKKIVFLVVIGCLLAAPVLATENGAKPTNRGNWKLWTIDLPSMAQNAIDTTIVDISDALWTIAAVDTAGDFDTVSTGAYGTADFQYEMDFSVSFEGATGVDSLNIQIDYGYDYFENPEPVGVSGLNDQNWTALYSLASTASNVTSTTHTRNLKATVPCPYLRFACKNVDATTGTSQLVIAYRVR